MLTVHEQTFEMHWAGWGAMTPYAERVAQATMLRLLNMRPEEVTRLARSQRAMTTMSAGARIAVEKLLAKRGRPVPYNGVIELRSMACPKE